MNHNSDVDNRLLNNSYFEFSEIEYAINLLTQMKTERLFISKSFHEEVWKFSHEYSPGRVIRIDFGKIKINLAPDEIINIKLWVISLIERHRVSTCISYFHYFIIALNESNNFSLERLEYFTDWLHQNHLSNNEKVYLFSNVFDFFDYRGHLNANEYIPKLYEIRQKIKFKKNSIQLPSSKYILMFSYYLELYFDDLEKNILLNKKQSYEKKILFYPILIWWKLTTIIPMRSTEFCIIRRNCLSTNNNQYFIKIDRIKNQSSQNVTNNFYTKIEINEEIYNLIDCYIDITNSYGASDTLISYASLASVDYGKQRLMQKKNNKSFNKNNFEKLLLRFYKEIICDFYNLNIPIYQRLSANDTRHIAFISLMMQGISPIEIARMGGHSTIAAQYNYSFHTEYWIDNEVFKLVNNNKNTLSKYNEVNYVPDNIIIKAFEPSSSTHKSLLSIGYCTDPFVRCEARECMLCSHWRIEPEELITKQHLIISKIKDSHSKVDELMHFIYKIQTKTSLKPSSLEYYKNEKNLENTFLKLESELNNLAKFTQIRKGSL